MKVKFTYKVLILYLMFFLNLFSSEIILKSSLQKYPITSVAVFEEIVPKIQAENILDLASSRFIQKNAEVFDFSFSKSAYWLKFSVTNKMRNDDSVIIETPYFPNLSVQIFVFSKEGKLEKKYLQNYIKHKELNLVLEIPKDSTKIVVLKCYPEGFPMKIPITIWTKKGFSQKIINEYSTLFLYFGIMLFLALNCIILGVFFKANSYSAFGVYIFTFVLLYFYTLEVPRLFGLATVTLNKVVSFTFFLNTFSLLLFTQIYFKVKHCKLKLVYIFAEFFCAAAMLATLISKKFRISLLNFSTFTIMIVGVSALLIFTVILQFNKKRKEAIYYSAAMSPYLLAFTIRVLEMTKILPATVVIEYSALIGGFTSALLFYFLIGRRIKTLYQHREESHQNIINLQKENTIALEELVNERTNELEEKNIQLEKQTKLMENKKEILHSLLLVSSGIQRIKSIDDSIIFMLDDIGKLFGNTSFGIILNGERESIINSVYFYETSQLEKNILINSQDAIIQNSTLLNFENDSFNIIRRYIYVIENNIWSILPLFSSKGEVLGKMFVNKKEIQEHHLEIITIFIDQMTVITENMILTTSLEKMANTDSLTGVYNRNFFDEQFAHYAELANNFGIHFSVISIDINGLKRINDIYGHEEGDKLIINAANILKEVTRSSDVLARVGGDEFIILCPSTDINGAKILVERIQKLQNNTTLCFTSFNDEKTEELCIHMSIGISGSSLVSTDDILKDADQKMYIDKKEYYKTNNKYRSHE